MKTKLMFFLLVLFLTPLTAQQKKPFSIDDLYRIKNVGSPVLSPTGKLVLFTVGESNLKEGKTNTDIYIMKSDGSGIKNLTNSDKNEYAPFWSTSDDKFYYTQESQIYQYDIDEEEGTKVTDFYTGIENPLLSKDGKFFIFSSEIYPECGADNSCNEKISKSSADGPMQAYIADKLLFRHWTSYKEEKEPALFLYNIEKNEVKKIVESNWFASAYMLGGDVKFDVSPDGSEICFMKNPEKNIEASTNADLFLIDINGTNTPENITAQNKAWDGYPAYSPDGKYIVYKVQRQINYEADRYRIAVYDRGSKTSEILTENFDYTINDISWSDDSKSVYFTADFEGYTPIYNVSIKGGTIEQVTSKGSIFGYEILPENEIIYLARSIDKPGEIYKWKLKDYSEKQVTFFNKELLDKVDIRSSEQLWVEGADGKKVHLFLVKPHNFDASKKYPVIINVHGGPQSQWMDSFRGDWQVYPGAGYVVAFPNPHGSTGYGSAYTEAISGDWGGKVYEDLMKVTDALEKLPYVDKENIGAMGWSFGGYMMNWFQAKTKRFKCLASMMGIYDLKSMWGATEELWFVNWDLKGQPWNSDSYDKYSPSNYSENFSTPTLIITGERDYRVPYTQSVQYFTALQTLGIDSRLIIFKNDGHWPNGIKSMPLYYNAHLEWFHKYLGGGEAPYDSRVLIKNIAFGE